MAHVAGEVREAQVRKRIAARGQASAGRAQRHERRALRRGQSLIIFALSFTVLLSLVGLTVDALRAFDLYARMQRAAEAGAMAGVLYMPTYYNVVRTGDTDSAISRASKEVLKNGFGKVLSPTAPACPTPVTSTEVAVCSSPTVVGDLQVYITEQLNLVLLSALGLGPATLVASAQADSLPPIQLGSSANYMGMEVACSPGGGSLNTNSSACAINDTTQNHVQNFLVSMNGPATPKESGDPFVYCSEGPSSGSSTQASPPFQANGTDPGTTTNPFPFYTYNGFATNHPQWSDVSSSSTTSLAPISNHCGVPTSGAKPGNPDQQPSGYNSSITAGTAHPGGYNYRIDIGSTVSGASVWVYNPVYIPQDVTNSNCTAISPIPLDHFLDSGQCNSAGVNTGAVIEPTYYQGPTGEGISNRYDGVHHDAPLFFFNTYITLYKVNADYDRSSDQQLVNSNIIGQSEFDAYDATSADLTQHGCTSGQVYDPNWGKKNGGADTPNTYHNLSSRQLGQGCVTPSTSTYADVKCWLKWCKISPTGGLGPGAYRLTIEAAGISSAAVNSLGQKDYTSGPADGYGSHAYAVAACDSDTVPDAYGIDGCKDGSFGAGQYKNPQVVVSSWNNTDMTFQGALAARTPNKNYPQTACVTTAAVPYACLDAGCIPTAFAGRTITLGLFNVASLTAATSGVTSGSLYISVVPPAGGGSVTYPASVQSTLTTIDGEPAVNVATDKYSPFHGLWFLVTLTLPTSYTGLCNPLGGTSGNTGEWQIMYASSANYQIDDKMTVALSLSGSPIHLVPLG